MSGDGWDGINVYSGLGGVFGAPDFSTGATAPAPAPPPPPPPPAAAAAPPTSRTVAGWGRLASTLRSDAAGRPAAGSSGGAAPPPPVAAATVRAADRPGNTLCTFFLASGGCRNGDACRFRHVRAEPWAVEYFEEELARLRAEPTAGAGGGGAASAALAAAASEADFSAASAAWRASAAQEQAMLRAAVAAGVSADLDAAEVALHAAERAISRDVECGVCLERVVEIPGRRFGLLTHCKHAFCLPCIREWRARIDLPPATVRSCPLCRTLSFFVIPSDRFVADDGRKARLTEDYTAAAGRVPCRLWDLGRGTCPFGSSCHFVHLMPDGSVHQPGRHVFRMGEDGEVRGVGKPATLAEFLGLT